MCYVQYQNILVNVLVLLLKPVSFRLRCPSFLLSKRISYFTNKVNTICGAGRNTRNLCHKFNCQGSAFRILGLRVVSPESQALNFRVLSVKVLCPRVPVPGSWVSGSRVPGTQSPRLLGPRSWVSGS